MVDTNDVQPVNTRAELILRHQLNGRRIDRSTRRREPRLLKESCVFSL